MSTGGPSGFGQGGQPNFYPGRGFPEYGSDSYRDAPNDFSGGARGPAALPSRTTAVVGNGPAPADPRIAGFDLIGMGERLSDGSGQQGVISYHRGAYVENAGAPRVNFDNVLGHGTIPWSRPTYPNVAGLQGYHNPTQQPSWTADTAVVAGGPRHAIPVSKKRISNFTVRRPYGDTSSGELFRTGSLADFVAGLPSGMNLQGKRWLNQSKTRNPTLVNRSTWSQAGSYGQTTAVLNTTPSNVPVTSPYGSY